MTHKVGIGLGIVSLFTQNTLRYRGIGYPILKAHRSGWDRFSEIKPTVSCDIEGGRCTPLERPVIVNVRFVPGATWDVSYRTCAAHTLHAAGAIWDEWTCGVTVVVSQKNKVVFTESFTGHTARVRGGSFARAHLLLEHKGARRCHLGASALPNATWKK
jgi:hypothetical protein